MSKNKNFGFIAIMLLLLVIGQVQAAPYSRFVNISASGYINASVINAGSTNLTCTQISGCVNGAITSVPYQSSAAGWTNGTEWTNTTSNVNVSGAIYSSGMNSTIDMYAVGSKVCTASNGACPGGAGGNPFNQSLNTTENVSFGKVTTPFMSSTTNDTMTNLFLVDDSGYTPDMLPTGSIVANNVSFIAKNNGIIGSYSNFNGIDLNNSEMGAITGSVLSLGQYNNSGKESYASIFASATNGGGIFINDGSSTWWYVDKTKFKYTIGPTTLSNVSASKINISSGTLTASDPALYVAQTWNSGGVTFNGVVINITPTASAAASTMFSIKNGTGSVFSIGKTGNIFMSYPGSQLQASQNGGISTFSAGSTADASNLTFFEGYGGQPILRIVNDTPVGNTINAYLVFGYNTGGSGTSAPTIKLVGTGNSDLKISALGTGIINVTSNTQMNNVNMTKLTINGAYNDQFTDDHFFNYPGYAEIAIWNRNGSLNSSSDLTLYAAGGTLDRNQAFITIGTNAQTIYNDPAYNATGVNDSYAYAQNGSLLIGTSTTGKNILFAVGGTTTNNLVANITATGIATNKNISINGNLVALSGTCAAGQIIQNVTANGVQCVADQTGGAGGNPFDQVLNTTSNVTFANLNISAGGAIFGAGGSVGGANYSIQFNNNGNLNGSTYAGITSTGYLSIYNASEPAYTNASTIQLFAEQRGAETLFEFKGSGGYNKMVQPHIAYDDIIWCEPAHTATGTTAELCFGTPIVTAIGTQANPAISGATLRTGMVWTTGTTAATTNDTLIEWRFGGLNWMRGNNTFASASSGAQQGGFKLAGRINQPGNNPAGSYWGIGMSSTNAALTAASNWYLGAAAANEVFIGHNITQTTLGIWSANATSGAVRAVDCGINYPAGNNSNATEAVYEFQIYAPSAPISYGVLNSTSISVYLKRLDNSSIPPCTASLTTAIPGEAVPMTFHYMGSNGKNPTATNAVLGKNKIYLSKDS